MTLQAVLNEVSPVSFTIKIGNRKLLSGLIEKFTKTNEKEKTEKVLIWLDKLQKIGFDKTRDGLLTELSSTSKEDVEELLNILISSNDKTKRQELKEKVKDDNELSNELEKLEKLVLDLNSQTRSTKSKVEIDLSIARGLGYYTGTVFETFLDKLPNFGSVCSGGRYDELTNRFTASKMPGIGGSLGLDRFLAALDELNLLNEEESFLVYLAFQDESALSFAMQIASELRKNQIKTEVSLKQAKLANQFRSASRLKANFVVIIGEEELKNKTVSFKNMKTSKQENNISLKSLIEKLKNFKEEDKKRV